MELAILPRWQIEIEVPLILLDPRDTPSVGGVGDITVESKVLVWRSLERLAAAAVGVEGRFPSGSERRGLGGEAAVEPFATLGIALGDFDGGPHEQELSASAAVAWRLHRLFAPLVELASTRDRGRG